VINRMASRRFIVRAGLSLLILAALGLYLGTRYRLGIDSQGVLPVRLHELRTPVR
jgi:hypothetical protein